MPDLQTKKIHKILSIIKNNRFILSIFVALLCGFLVGVLIKNSDYKSTQLVEWVQLPGKMFIRSLELLILPVIFFGVVTACASISAKKNLKITLFSLSLILIAHLISTTIGAFGSLILTKLVDVNLNTNVASVSKTLRPQKKTFDIIADILHNFIPKNIIKATTHQEITIYSLKTLNNASSFSKNIEYIEGTNLLGILFFAILLGLAISTSGETFLKDFFHSSNKVLVKILKWLITLFPLGLISLIASTILEIDNLNESIKQISLFAIVCSATILFYCFFILTAFVLILTRKNPILLFWYFFEPVLLAFASTSGAVCIHKGIEVCETKLKMNQLFSRFIVPFYTTLKADGSAVFITISCAFLAQLSGHSMSLGDYLVVLIETSILCLCLPSVPSASIMTILVVLNTINVHNANIGLLYTVEWLLDRLRSATNVYSHCLFSFITHEWFKHEFDKEDDDLREECDDNENKNKSTENSSFDFDEIKV